MPRRNKAGQTRVIRTDNVRYKRLLRGPAALDSPDSLAFATEKGKCDEPTRERPGCRNA